jgi:outer membrane cobalamin receptor
LPYDNELQINYTRRIRRPWGGQLNSFRDISDPTNIRFGNPELEPQYSNAFELNYIKSWTYHMISVSAYMRTSDNVINRISYLSGDVMYTTYANVSKVANSGVEFVVKNNLFKSHLDLTTTVNLYNNHISAWNYTLKDDFGNPVTLSGDKQNSFAWDIRCMATVRLPWNLNFQATGRYSSKHLEAQGSHQGGWSVDLGLRRAFGNWSVSLNCRDLFDSRKFKNTVNDIDYSQYSERWRGGRRIQLTIKYSFGNMKSKPGRHQDSEPMDGSGYGDME